MYLGRKWVSYGVVTQILEGGGPSSHEVEVILSVAQEPKVRGPYAGGEWIRTSSSAGSVSSVRTLPRGSDVEIPHDDVPMSRSSSRRFGFQSLKVFERGPS